MLAVFIATQSCSTPMERHHFDQTLSAFKKRRPFQPLTVVRVDGDRFEVDFPNALAVRDGMAVCISAGGAPILFDYESVSQIIGDLSGQTETE
jgi:hypothetical protein